MSYLTGNYITKSGLESIKEHKYKPGVYAPIDKLFTPFWNYTVELCPMWLAPNMITFIGLLCAFVLYFPMLYHDMSMSGEIPAYTYVLNCLGVFLFQTLDAIDGKQARRTNSSSPLGQLFDHGCDAISWTVCCMSLISIFRFGYGLSAILVFIASTAPFFLLNILEMYSGTFEYDIIPGTDPTSSQLNLIFFNMLPVIFGTDLYAKKLSYYLPWIPSWITRDFILGDVSLLIISYFGIVLTFVMIKKCIQGASQTNNTFKCVMQIISFFGIYLVMFSFDPKVKFVRENAGLVFFWCSTLYYIICTKLIICIMAKMDYTWLHLEYGV